MLKLGDTNLFEYSFNKKKIYLNMSRWCWENFY